MANRTFWKGKRVLVTGGAGFIGSYVVRSLIEDRGLTAGDVVVPRSREYDLRSLENCLSAVKGCDVVIHLAAVTGGIGFSRTYPASQYYDSTLIDLNMVEAARRAGVKKLVAIGNLFAYAADAPIPLQEETLFDGLPAGPHRGVGWLKRNLAVQADLYHRQYGFPMVVVYSANAYGPGDTLDPEHAHVIPSTIMKCFCEENLMVWGDGTPTRDFLFASDVAEGLLLAAESLDAPQFVNIGSESEVSIRELVEVITHLTGFHGMVSYDTSKSGGDARRSTSSAMARRLMGFRARVPIEEGLKQTVAWYRKQLGKR